MSYRHNPHGYYDNPRETDYEAESKRVMAVVQHVLDKVSRRDVHIVFRQARAEKNLKGLAANALKIMEPLTTSMKFLEVAVSALMNPDQVESFGTADIYYIDSDKPPDSNDDDPGLLVRPVSTGVGKSGDGDFFDGDTWRTASDKVPMARRSRDKYILGYNDLLSIIWARVTDSDVQNAAAILRKEGIYFYRKYKISEDDWVARHGPDSVEDYTGSHFVRKKVTSRDEFLRSYADEQPTDVVLRVNVGRLVRELQKIDFEPDDVVYRHGGTNNSIGGASARGFYVAQLRPGQLIIEGMSPPVGLGICVGDGSYQRKVIAGKMSIYGIRAPPGKPKFTISIDPPGIEQVKGAANRVPGFDPGSGEFKGEAGVDDVRVVVEFLMVFLGMQPKNETFKGDERENSLKPGLLAMQRVDIDPFSPPVKGQTWERAQKERQAKIEDIRRQYVALRVAYYLARYHPDDDVTLSQPDDAELRQWATKIYQLQDDLQAFGGSYVMKQATEEIDKQLDQYFPNDFDGVGAEEAEEAKKAARVPPPARRLDRIQALIRRLDEPRENPDLASYSDPEVAALALAAYERPMGGMWTYEDDEDEE